MMCRQGGLSSVTDTDQRLSPHLTIGSDRDGFVLTTGGLPSAARAVVPVVRSNVVTRVLRLPYAHVVVTASR